MPLSTLVAAALLTLAPAAAVGDAPAPALRFLDQAELSVRVVGGTARTSLAVLNDSPTDTVVSFSALVTDDNQVPSDDDVAITVDDPEIPARAVQRLNLTVSVGEPLSSPLRGHLIVAGTGDVSPDARPIVLQGKVPARVPWEAIIVVGAAGIALALMVFRWAVWRPDPSTRPSLTQRLGPANWRFSDSWASTLTAVGAFLGAILGSEILPADARYIPRAGFGVLSLVFGFLVVLAPFIYNATSSRARSSSPGAGVSYEGQVRTFLLATAVTIWAVFGELATIGFIAAELTGLGAVFYLLLAVLVPVAVLMARYCWRSIRWVLEVQAEEEIRRAGLAPEEARRRPAWAVL